MMQSFGYLKAIVLLLIFMLINIVISFSIQFLLQINLINYLLFKFLLGLTFLLPFFTIYLLFHRYIQFKFYLFKDLKLYIILIVIAFSIQILGTTIEMISMTFIPENYQNYYNLLKDLLMPKNSIDLLVSIISIGIIAPIFEELLFRGIILQNLISNNKNIVMANLFQSLLFGIAHMNPFQLLYAIPIGFYFGILYIKTKNIWVPISIHIFTNSLAIILSKIEIHHPYLKKFLHFGEGVESIKEIPIDPIIFSLIVILFSIFLVPRLFKKIKD
jgi:membrane protease YdiL (CAAX protease family)